MKLFRLPSHRPLRSKTSRRLELERLEDRNLLSASVLASGYGQLPLAFEANQGQTAGQVNYLARGSGYTLFLTPQETQVRLGSASGGTALDLQLVGANPSAPAIGQDELVTKSNYLVGGDSSQWLTNIANYGQVEYQSVYQGVDALYSGNQGQLETTFLVHPGASAGVIQMRVQGAQGLSLDVQGDLVLHTAGGDVIEQAPVAYQEINGARQAVSSRFVLEGNNQVGFQVGSYDHGQTLTIDPTLSYSSYLAGAGYAIAVDGGGDAYVTGAAGTNFPTTPGAFQTSGDGVFVAKLNAAGTALVYSTYLGNGTPLSNWSSGSGVAGSGIAVDAAGDAYVTGLASANFPTTPNAFQTSTTAKLTGFVSVLNPTGSGLLYSTYLSGVKAQSSFQYGSAGGAIAIDGAGNAYVTGNAGPGLVTTANAFQTSYLGYAPAPQAFFAEINPNLAGSASLLYSTYLGGSSSGSGQFAEGTGIAVDASGAAYLAGRTTEANFPTTPGAFQRTTGGGLDVFVAKFNPSLSGSASLVYSTYLGGSYSDGYVSDQPGVISGYVETAPAIAVDASGDAYVAGVTNSPNFPTTPGAFQTTYHAGSGTKKNPIANPADAFVTKLNATGTALIYSTYLGGSGLDGASGIALDSSGNAYVTGWTRSTDFPTVNPIQAQKSSGNDPNGNPNSDVFVATLNASGSALLFSTYFGGAGNDEGFGVAVDSAGNVYVTGATASTNFPTTAGALQTAPGGGFVFKIDPPAGGQLASPLTASLSSGEPITPSGASGGGLNAHSPSAVHAQSATPTAAGKGPDVFQTDLSTLLTDGGTFGDWRSDQETVAAGWSPSDMAFLLPSDALQRRMR